MVNYKLARALRPLQHSIAHGVKRLQDTRTRRHCAHTHVLLGELTWNGRIIASEAERARIALALSGNIVMCIGARERG